MDIRKTDGRKDFGGFRPPQPLAAAGGIRPHALSPDFHKAIRRVHWRYFNENLLGLIKFVKSKNNFGFVNLLSNFPVPTKKLEEEFGVRVYPHFSIIDCDPANKDLVISILMPFRIRGELFTVQIKLSRAPKIGKTLTAFEHDSLWKVHYICGKDFEAERNQRLKLNYDQEASFVSSIKNNPAYLSWLVDKIGSPGRILSLGVGEGEIEGESQKQYGNQIVGIELNANRAVIARRQSLQIIEGDANAFLSLLEGAGITLGFDAVILLESLGYLYWDVFFEQVKQALKPDGELIFTTSLSDLVSDLGSFGSPYYEYHPWERTRKVVESFGFDIREFHFLKRTIVPGKGSSNPWIKFEGTTENEAESDMVFVRARRNG